MMWLFLLACASKNTTEVASPASQVPPDKAAMATVHMSQNFEKATSAKDAIVLGTPDQARADLGWLGDNIATDALGTPGASYLTAVKVTAKAASQSPTTPELGEGLGKVVGTCGACHAGFDVTLSPVVATRPEGGHVNTGSWLVGALWTGVLANADSAWQTGASAMALEPQDLSGYGVATPGPAAEDALATMKELTARAATATDRESRARVLGRVIGACGSCHVEVHGVK